MNALLVLAVLVLGTRVGHFGGALALPDATLAAFFLAGFWMRSGWAFPVLLLVAGVADQWAFVWSLSPWCYTPAYPFLVPAYACLWLAGYATRGMDVLTAGGGIRIAAAVVVSCAAAFTISSGSYFLWSGYFDTMSASDYWRQTADYFPPYAGWTMAYVLLAFLARAMFGRVTRPARIGSR
jgi:hypothetical protein